MADPVKISELPAIASVQANDILPIVDAALTQTSKATAAQVAAIGGGPPGDNTVTTAKLASNAVTAAKCAFTAPDKLFSRTAAGAGQGVEIDCTPYARGLLSQLSAANARDYLDALQTTNNPVFTGQVQVADGSAMLPSIANTDNTDTGIFFPAQNALGIALEGQEFVRFIADGTSLSRSPAGGGVSVLMPAFDVRAWVLFNGMANTQFVINNPAAIAARYGFPGQSLWHEANTLARIAALETGYGNTIIATSTVQADGRSNYTSPWNNVHYYWTGSAWATVPASGRNWIGSITLQSNTVTYYRNGGNVTGIVDLGVGTYQINFATPMPDIEYGTLLSSTRQTTWSASGDQPMTRTISSVSVQHIENGVAADTSNMIVAILR